MLTSSSAALTAMRETATWTARLTEQYVAEVAMITDSIAGGMIYEAPPCPRGPHGVTHAHFTLGRPGTASRPAAGRRLMQSLNQSGVVDDQLEQWQGYVLSTLDTGGEGAWRRESAGIDTPERARYLGEGGRNRLVAGLMLHTTRKPTQLDCSHSNFVARYALGCSSGAFYAQMGDDGSHNRSSFLQQLASLLGPEGTDLHPYGVDPVYLRSSSLYQPRLVGRESQYYNTSDPNEVPKATGVPFGYYHRPVPVRP